MEKINNKLLDSKKSWNKPNIQELPIKHTLNGTASGKEGGGVGNGNRRP
jgi:hypothetical protein